METIIQILLSLIPGKDGFRQDKERNDRLWNKQKLDDREEEYHCAELKLLHEEFYS